MSSSRSRRRLLPALVLLTLATGVGGCSSVASQPPGPASSGQSGQGGQSGQSGQRTVNHPDVVDAVATREADGTWSFKVTMTSPYDTAEHYADGWRVKNSDGTVYGEMTLTHDHASEQPFTRTQQGVRLPAGTTSVVIEGRDIDNGYGGATQTVATG